MSASDSHTPHPTDDEIDLGELLRTLWFHKLPIILTGFMFFLGGVIYALTSTPIYQADAMLEISNSKNQVLGELNDLLSNQQTPADTEIQLIQSRLILGKAVQELHLDNVVQPKISFLDKLNLGRNQSPTVQLERFEVLHKDWQNKAFTLIAQGPSEYTLITPAGTRYVGRIGQVLATKSGFSLHIKQINADFGQEFHLSHYSKLNSIENLRQSLTVSGKGKNLPLIGLSMTGTDPELITKILNSIIKNYIAENRDKDIQTAQNGLKFINEELPRLHQELQEAEDKLNQYRAQNKSLDLPNEARGTLDSLNKLKMQIVDLKTEESVLADVYTREHPAYKAVTEKLHVLEEAKKRLNKQIVEMPATQQEVIRLTRNVEINQAIYMQLLNKRQELSILRASSQGNVRVIDQAVAAEHPIKPKKAIIVALATLVGFFLAIMGCLLKSMIRTGITSFEDLSVLGIDLVGSIPSAPEQKTKDALFKKLMKNKDKNARSNYLLSVEDPEHITIEALRGLRTNLYFTSIDAENKAIMISGSSAEVGKTFVAANLAVLMAQSGKKVLLVDADMRKGYLHYMFKDAQNEVGLSNLLCEKKPNYNQFIQKTQVPQLDLISKGVRIGNPAELLLNNTLPAFLSWAEKHYDHIILDTPPILAVTDAAVIGQYTATSLLVTRFGKTHIHELDYCIDKFKNGNVKITGLVLNDIRKTAANAEQYKYYEYGENTKRRKKRKS